VASFPSNDWQIEINSSSNGGQSYFAINDTTAGQTLFRLCAVADATCTNIIPPDPQTTTNTSNIGTNTSNISTNTTNIARHEQQIGQLNSRVGSLEDDVDSNKDGVAMAIALGAGAPLQAEQNGAISFNLGHFDGANALGFNGSARINDKLVLNGGLGYGVQENVFGGRIGLLYSW
jgi:hypothetical protein